MKGRALITGITGQDGSYLAEYLLKTGYEVHGIIRRASTFNTARIEHLYKDPHVENAMLRLHYGDITDSSRIKTLIQEVEPDYVFNLAAQSHVKVSFDMPIHTAEVNAVGSHNILEAVRKSNLDTRFYQASSSEMFGSSPPPQSEETPFHPRSPYAVTKIYAYWATVNYRESYGIKASNGILFNHESPRRGETFVTRKITRAVADIVAKNQEKLYLGNLDSKRDWGYAPEYVMGMFKIANHHKADDFVLGTGESYSVRDFLGFAFGYVDLSWEDYVEIDPRYMRPAEVDALNADPSKAIQELDWKPCIKAPELAKVMVDHDMMKLGLKPPMETLDLFKSNNLNWVTEH